MVWASVQTNKLLMDSIRLPQLHTRKPTGDWGQALGRFCPFPFFLKGFFLFKKYFY